MIGTGFCLRASFLDKTKFSSDDIVLGHRFQLLHCLSYTISRNIRGMYIFYFSCVNKFNLILGFRDIGGKKSDARQTVYPEILF